MQKSSFREHFRSRLGIIFATSGSAIGLGTLWKLPYLIGQGGGSAFIMLFLIFTLFLGMPLFIAELALGKHFQRSVVGVFNNLPTKKSGLQLFGPLALIVTFLIAGWYGVVSGFGLNYLVMALTDVFSNKTPTQLAAIFKEFRSLGSLVILWQAIFVATTCLILAKGVKAGIERFSKLFFSLLFFLILGLFFYATTLSGFKAAVAYVFVPDFAKINKETILSALGLSLFTLSLGQGIMITYGSYLSRNQNIFRTALVVTFSVIIISILISLMIFPMIFTFSFPPEAGESLLFITMPYVTEQLPGSMAISALFFILLIFAALTSYMGQIEVIVSSFMETFFWSRKKAATVAGIGVFLVGLPTALMTSSYNPYKNFEKIFHRSFLESSYILIDWMLLTFSLGVCVAVAFVINKDDMAKTLSANKNSFVFASWHFLIRYVVPFSIFMVAGFRLSWST